MKIKSTDVDIHNYCKKMNRYDTFISNLTFLFGRDDILCSGLKFLDFKFQKIYLLHMFGVFLPQISYSL